MVVEDVTVRGRRLGVACAGGGIVSTGCASYTVVWVLSVMVSSLCRNVSLTRRAGAVTTSADVEATFSAVRQAQTVKASRKVNARTRIILRMYITVRQWRNFSRP
jgi:hypothetical protein